MAGFLDKSLECGYETLKGSPCKAPKLKGTSNCRKHQPSQLLEKEKEKRVELENNQIESAKDQFDNRLEKYDDIVRWKEHYIKKAHLGDIRAGLAETMLKMLTSLQDSMSARDKSDPDKESKRVFSTEAALKAAREMTGEQAAMILRGGQTDFLAFLCNPKLTGRKDEEDEDEKEEEIAEEHEQKVDAARQAVFEAEKQLSALTEEQENRIDAMKEKLKSAALKMEQKNAKANPETEAE